MRKITVQLLYISILFILPYQIFSQNVDSLEKRLETLSDKDKVTTLIQLSENYLNKNNTKGIDFGKKALDLSQEYDMILEKAKALKNLGKLYYVSGNLSDALSDFYLAAQTFEIMKMKEDVVDIEIQIGDIYYDLKDYIKSIEMYLRAFDSTNKNDNRALLLNNIGNVYYRNGDNDKALEYYFKSLSYEEMIENKKSISDTYSNIAYIYEEQGNYKEAIKNYLKCHDIETQTNNSEGNATSHINIGRLYSKMKQYDNAVNNILEGIRLSKEIDSRPNTEYGYKILASVYDSLKDYSDAYKYEKLYTELHDSLFTRDMTNKIAESQTKYETALKDREIQSLQNQNKVLFLQRTFGAIAIVLILVIFLIIYIDFRRKQKLNKLLQELNNDLKIKNEQLAKSEKELQELNEGKDKYFAILAHDLRSPFHGLLGFSSILLNDYDILTDEEKKEFIADINSSTKNIYNLMENLLMWSRLQTGRIEFNKSNINLSDTLNKVINLLKSGAAKKNIKIINKISENISILADENMLISILQNLISNSIKFSNKEGFINIECSKNNGTTEISVTDNGIGIKKDNLDKLFRLEEHLSTKGTDYEDGSGLGLVLCYEFVKRHNGEISVESEYGKGSKFKFTIPNN